MIKLAHDLYKNFEDDYFKIIKAKINNGIQLFEIVEQIAQKNPQWVIKKQDEFLQALIINPFSEKSRKDFLLLRDYYNYVVGASTINPFEDYLDELKKIFDYTNIIKSQDNQKILRVRVVKASGIEICPYCNRQYIDIFDRQNDDGKKAIAQLDHFYPKEQFPLYALSLYNFVPSCGSCNQGKSDKTKLLIYPFTEKSKEENQQPYFKIKSEDLDHLRGNVLPEIDYAFIDSDKKTHADSLHHKNMYQNHRVFAQRLLQRQRLYNPSYIAQVKEFFPKLSDEEIREVLFGFSGDLEELKQKPLSKLAHDILDLNKK